MKVLKKVKAKKWRGWEECADIPSKECVDKSGKLWENWLEGCLLREANNGFLLSTFQNSPFDLHFKKEISFSLY